jgi:hypothetical protein
MKRQHSPRGCGLSVIFESQDRPYKLTLTHTVPSTSFTTCRFRVNRLRSRGPEIQSHQQPTTATVRGTTIATNSCQLAPSSIRMLKTEAKNVPGRNTIVIAAMVFIAAPSALASSAIAVLVVASCCVTRLKTFVNSLVQDHGN